MSQHHHQHIEPILAWKAGCKALHLEQTCTRWGGRGEEAEAGVQSWSTYPS